MKSLLLPRRFHPPLETAKSYMSHIWSSTTLPLTSRCAGTAPLPTVVLHVGCHCANCQCTYASDEWRSLAARATSQTGQCCNHSCKYILQIMGHLQHTSSLPLHNHHHMVFLIFIVGAYNPWVCSVPRGDSFWPRLPGLKRRVKDYISSGGGYSSIPCPCSPALLLGASLKSSFGLRVHQHATGRTLRCFSL